MTLAPSLSTGMLEVMGKYKFWASIWAHKDNHALRLSGLLQRGFDSLVEAVATQLMRGL